jgi:hypothetical protein
MGSIAPNRRGVVVTFTAQEIIESAIVVEFQNVSDRKWRADLFDLIKNIAKHKIQEKAGHLNKAYNMVKIEGDGEIRVTFFHSDDPSAL